MFTYKLNELTHTHIFLVILNSVLNMFWLVMKECPGLKGYPEVNMALEECPSTLHWKSANWPCGAVRVPSTEVLPTGSKSAPRPDSQQTHAPNSCSTDSKCWYSSSTKTCNTALSSRQQDQPWRPHTMTKQFKSKKRT